MPYVTFVSHQGERRIVGARGGQSLMEVAISQGIDAIEAACGGACSCATCHVLVEPDWVDRLPPPTSIESEMLSAVAGAGARSRLSCQIKISEQLDGLIVRTPAAQG